MSLLSTFTWMLNVTPQHVHVMLNVTPQHVYVNVECHSSTCARNIECHSSARVRECFTSNPRTCFLLFSVRTGDRTDRSTIKTFYSAQHHKKVIKSQAFWNITSCRPVHCYRTSGNVFSQDYYYYYYFQLGHNKHASRKFHPEYRRLLAALVW